MKKIISFICFITILLSMMLTVFAGSIDVDLVADDEALVFIGTIDDYEITDEEEDYPSTEYTLALTPNQKIKGDVQIGKSMNFEKVRIGSLKLQKGTKYLFGYMMDKLHIWELESYDDLFDWEIDDYTNESIILKERHNNSIAEGMQDFLNEGVFERAEIERQDIGNQISFAEFLPASDGTPLEVPAIPKKNYIGWIVGGAAVAFVIAFIIGFAVKKKKSGSK